MRRKRRNLSRKRYIPQILTPLKHQKYKMPFEKDSGEFTEEPPYCVIEEHILRMAYLYEVFSPLYME